MPGYGYAARVTHSQSVSQGALSYLLMMIDLRLTSQQDHANLASVLRTRLGWSDIRALIKTDSRHCIALLVCSMLAVCSG